MAAEPVSTLPDLALEPRPLEYVSPSRLGALEACFLQAAFAADAAYQGWTFKGPGAQLGSACHALLERVTRGELARVPSSERRSELERMWSEEVARVEEASLSSPLTRHLGPARHWRGYALQRARVIRRAEDILERAGSRRQGASSTHAERYYQAYEGRVRGRADLVRSRNGRTEIHDYKTGEIYEEAQHGGAPLLRPLYRRQLLLYAAMHRWETGEWPTTAHVVPLVGESSTIEIEPAEAEQEARRALELLGQFNDWVSQAGSPEMLASPSEHACQLCRFRPFCEPFWAHVSPSWGWAKSVALEGLVMQVHVGQAGGWTAEVKVERGHIEPGVYKLSGSRSVVLEEGQRLRAVNLMTLENAPLPALVVTGYTELWQR
jgi:RecB family exonuclease